MSGFVKLDSRILQSSIWAEDYSTRVVWITILALADCTGKVDSSVSGLYRAANVTQEECVAAIEKLESPDKDSRSQEYEGRRIERIEGGWLVLNYSKYRQHSYSKNPEATRKRNYRNKKMNTKGHVPNSTGHSASASASDIQEKSINNLETLYPDESTRV